MHASLRYIFSLKNCTVIWVKLVWLGRVSDMRILVFRWISFCDVPECTSISNSACVLVKFKKKHIDTLVDDMNLIIAWIPRHSVFTNQSCESFNCHVNKYRNSELISSSFKRCSAGPNCDARRNIQIESYWYVCRSLREVIAVTFRLRMSQRLEF